jgi:hypothetical protein
MLIAEFKIKISGNLKKGELIQLDPTRPAPRRHSDCHTQNNRIDIQVKIACQSRRQGEAVV